MKEITMKIRIDERNHTTELRRAGCRVPEFCINDDSADAVAETWRALAAYAMESAFGAEHYNDFCAPDFTNEEWEKMATRICKEYSNILTAKIFISL